MSDTNPEELPPKQSETVEPISDPSAEDPAEESEEEEDEDEGRGREGVERGRR
jgi:hypothetical protein